MKKQPIIINNQLRVLRAVLLLTMLSSVVSSAQIDHAFIKAKNDFIQAIGAGDWDKAKGSFSLIEEDFERAGPALVSTLQNELKQSLSRNDFESADMLVDWVAKLPKNTNMKSLHSVLTNKIVDSLEQNNFDIAEMTSKILRALPTDVNLNAVMSTWQNKVIDALNSGNYEKAQLLAKALSSLLDGTNINAVVSKLKNKIIGALEGDDHNKAEKLAKVSMYLPKNVNMLSVLSTLGNRTMNAIRQDDVDQAVSEASKEVAIASLLPEQAKQHYFEKSLLPEVARQISAAYQDSNWSAIKKWGAWLSQLKEHATSESGKNTVKNAEKFLGWAQKKMENE